MQFGDSYDASHLPATLGNLTGDLAGDPARDALRLADPLVTDLPDRVELRDTDVDGHPDTVALSGPGMGTLLFTDVEGDGSADVATRIGDDGTVTVAQRDPGGGWTAVERGRLGAGRPDPEQPATPDSGGTGHTSARPGSAGAGSADAGSGPPVVIDPETGEWTEI